MEVRLSVFEENITGAELHTELGHTYSTDIFEEGVFAALVGQVLGDGIKEIRIHRGTTKEQVLIGDLEQSLRTRILALL